MSFEIVERESTIVAGLTVPLAGREVTRRDLDLVNFTWDRFLARGKQALRVAAYVAQFERSAAVLGYECCSIDEVDTGDVLTVIPAGKYAKFTVVGKPYDLTRTAWADVAKAEAAGLIERTHVAEVEKFVTAESVEVYVSIAE